MDQLLRLSGNGITLDWLVFDEGYGAAVPLLKVLSLGGQQFVAEVPVNFAVAALPSGATQRADQRLSAAQAKSGRRYRLAHRTVADSVWRAAWAVIWVGDREYRLIVAINEATAEVKYFWTNTPSQPLDRVLAGAFCRWNGEHSLRLGKQEAGLMHYEGRDYIGRMRHLMLALIVLGFVATHTERLRGKNPDVTAEQVCRALNQRCAAVFRRRRRVAEVQHISEVICYHQRRNAQATKSHKKQRHRCVI